MYLRFATRKVGPKSYTYWRLVRSVRRGGKVVQETVAHLGELDAKGRARARSFAQRLMGKGEQRELFEENLSDDERVVVNLKGVRTERSRAFGEVWLGWELWRVLKLDSLCAELLPQGREHVAWSTMAAVLVIARLCEPSSELHIAEHWFRTTSLDDLLGVAPELINDDRLYRALDRLLPHKSAVEQHLKRRWGELFGVQYDLLLYDVTSTYFEGEALRNELAKRGYSRDSRSDCKQVNIALVVTRDGMPLGYEVFEGNRTDVTTVEQIVSTMEARFGVADRVWVMDRGMTSAKNIAWLQQGGRKYVIGTPKSELKRWSRAVMDGADWQSVRDGVEAKICRGPEGSETFLLCRSEKRREKEHAMHERFERRIEARLTKLKARLESRKQPVDRVQTERQVGRILQANQRASARYEVRLIDDARVPAGLRAEWSVRADWDEWAQASEGCYVLRTNVQEWSADAIWKTYVQLSEAEDAFRVQKSDLRIRPIWHQTGERVQAHILVCFLAFAMWKTLQRWMETAGLGNSPRALLDEMRAIRSCDVVLPIAERGPREVRLRCVVRPERHHAVLLDRLGLRVPERLKIARAVAGVASEM